jgi:predicted dehydrogenase
VELAERVNRVLMVDHTFVYTGAVRKIHELVASGEIGEIYYFDSTRLNLGFLQSQVDVLWDLAPHDLSILLYATGLRPRSLIGMGTRHVGSQNEVAYLLMKLPGSAIGHINVSWLAPAKVRTTIIAGSKKMIIYDDMQVVEKVKVYDRGVAIESRPTDPYELMVQYRTGDIHAPKLDLTEALRREIEHFAECIALGSEPITSGRDGLEIVEILEAASRSISEGGVEVAV